jgi:hypothetical protein
VLRVALLTACLLALAAAPARASRDWQPCTAPVKLTAKGARLKVGLDAGEKVRVVVARRR